MVSNKSSAQHKVRTFFCAKVRSRAYLIREAFVDISLRLFRNFSGGGARNILLYFLGEMIEVVFFPKSKSKAQNSMFLAAEAS